MKSLVVAFAGLLALAGCQNSTPSSSAAGPDSDAGAATFRLQATEVSVLEVTSDSIKIEAVRSGYPTVVAAGSLREAVAVEGLQPGPWNLRVAAFDRAHAIHWYGDTLAEILGGRKTEVVVRLRKATGTAIVRIILDSGIVFYPPPDTSFLGPRQDTLWTSVDSGRVSSSPVTQSLAGATRADYVFVRTPYNCGAPNPRLSRWVDTAGTVYLILYNKGPLREIACTMEYREQVLVYKPRSSTENIVVQDLQGKTIRLPGTRPNPSPSRLRFKVFEYFQRGGFTADASSYQLRLDSSGLLQVVHTTSVWATIPQANDSRVRYPVSRTRSDTTVRKLTAFEMDTVKRMLSDSSMAFPDSLPMPRIQCADAPWWKGYVSYTNGHAAQYSKPEEICSGLPANYERIQSLAWSLIDPPVLIDGGPVLILEPITDDTPVLIDGGPVLTFEPITTEVRSPE